MNVYFVRHGESEFNITKQAQHAGVSLSGAGREQADIVAKRFEHMPLDMIIASPYVRAKQTAEIIHKKIPQVPLQLISHFHENKKPTSIEGILYSDPIAQAYWTSVQEHIHDPEWRYEDEETFVDLKKRSELALAHLASLEKKNVLVVTHGNFLRFLFGYIIFGESFTHVEQQAIWKVLFMENTGVTLCRYDEKSAHWSIVTWNDLAHLAD